VRGKLCWCGLKPACVVWSPESKGLDESEGLGESEGLFTRVAVTRIMHGCKMSLMDEGGTLYVWNWM